MKDGGMGSGRYSGNGLDKPHHGDTEALREPKAFLRLANLGLFARAGEVTEVRCMGKIDLPAASNRLKAAPSTSLAALRSGRDDRSLKAIPLSFFWPDS